VWKGPKQTTSTFDFWFSVLAGFPEVSSSRKQIPLLFATSNASLVAILRMAAFARLFISCHKTLQ